MDRRGAIVNGLPPDVFTVLDNRVVQHIASFTEQDAPASLGLVLDVSGSMRDELSDAKVALRSFFQSANPEDEAFLYTVSSRPAKQSGFTGDYEGFLGRILFTGAQGSTALIDSVYASLDEMRSAAHARRALIVISDGMDNHSRYSKTELMRRAIESDVQIFSISIQSPQGSKKPVQVQEERQGILFLEELSRKTGGLQFVVREGTDIQHATASIGRALRNQYVIGYVPREADQTGWHAIQVKLRAPGATAHARSGYRSGE